MNGKHREVKKDMGADITYELYELTSRLLSSINDYYKPTLLNFMITRNIIHVYIHTLYIHNRAQLLAHSTRSVNGGSQNNSCDY